MKDSWEWYERFEEQSEDEGNATAEQICTTFREGHYCDENPQRQMSLYRRARGMAQRLGNRHLVLFLDHWCAQCMMHELCDHTGLLEVVVPAVVEVRQPQFADLPQRFCLQEDLINAYMAIDPIGHSAAIEESLAYFEREVPRELDCRYCFLHLRTEFELVHDRLDAAWESACAAVAEIAAHSDPHDESTRDHHLMLVYATLTSVAALRNDWDALIENAQAGLHYSQQKDDSEHLATFKLWEAVALKGLGEDADAKRLFQSGRRRRLKPPIMVEYFDAVSQYHELCNRPALALKARDQQLPQVVGQGCHWDECQCRLQRCKLASQMNKPDLLQSEADALREVAANLKHPQIITDKLDALIDDAPS